MDKNLLRKFWVLVESNENARVTCTSELIEDIKKKQGDSKKHCEELTYTLDRLIKGLSSPRKAARLGFTTAFTEVLRAFPVVKVNTVLDKVAEQLVILKSDDKSIHSNVYIGHLMAYLALIQSGRVLKANHGEIERLTNVILHVWKKKIPLHQMCCQALVELISKISFEDFVAQMWPLLQERLSCGWETVSPDTLWLLLTAEQYHHGNQLDKDFFLTHWKTKNLLNKKNYASLANIIVQSTADHPIVHPLCMQLLHKISEKEDRFEIFLTEVIYQKVFLNGTNCKYLVFQLIPHALKLATLPEQVYAILSPSLIACLLKNLSSKQQVLHLAAKKLNQQLIKVIDDLTEPLQVAMVMSLVTPPGTVLFDSVSKTSCVNSLMPKFNVEATKSMCKILMSNLQGEIMLRPNNTDEESKDKVPDLITQQKWSANMLSHFINHNMMLADRQWCISIAQSLFMMAFFEVKKSTDGFIKPSKPLDHTVTHNLNVAFFRALDKMLTFLNKGVKGYQTYNEILHQIVQHAQSLLDSNAVKLIKTFDGQVLEGWKKMRTVTQNIIKKCEKSSVSMNDELAFELLFFHHGLQLFTDHQSAMEVLKELHTCYSKANEKRRRRSTIKPNEEPDWVDVIVDLLMSLISQQSHLVRNVVSHVFVMLCPHLTTFSLQLILEPLETFSESDKNPLHFEESDEEDNEQDENDGMDYEEESKSDSDSSSEEEEAEEENGVDEDLKLSVKSALGGAAADSNDEESSEELDDEAMFRLDSALAAAFKTTAKAKKKQDQEREMQLRHYKMRCLDILGVVITHCKSVPLLLDLIMPLLSLMEAGVRVNSQQDLGNRARKVFYQLMRVKKLQLTPDTNMDKSIFPELVKDLVEYSTTASGIPMTRDTASACVFVFQLITSVEMHTGPSPVKTRAMAATKADKQKENREQSIRTIDEVLHIVEEGLSDFCVKRDSRLNHYFFLTMLENEPTLFWPLAHTILDHVVSKNVRIFCRTQASAMLTALINKSSIQHVDEVIWLDFAGQIIDAITALFQTCDEQVLKPRYLHELLVLLHKIITVLDVNTRQKLISEDLLAMVKQLKHSGSSDTRTIIKKVTGTCFIRTSQTEVSKKKKPKRKRIDSRSGDKVSPSPKHGKLSTKNI